MIRIYEDDTSIEQEVPLAILQSAQELVDFIKSLPQGEYLIKVEQAKALRRVARKLEQEMKRLGTSAVYI